jgi:hypothetical protein
MLSPRIAVTGDFADHAHCKPARTALVAKFLEKLWFRPDAATARERARDLRLARLFSTIATDLVAPNHVLAENAVLDAFLDWWVAPPARSDGTV